MKLLRLRKPRTELEKAIVERLEIKNPLIIPDPDGLHIISGNCYYCEDPWDIELEIALRDAETGELNGRSATVYVCKSCREAGKPTVEEDRITVTGVRD
jgi:hypothetical protein